VKQTSAVKGVALGLLAGVMSGLFGIGGGAVMVPLLVLWLAQPQHRAHATSLAAIIVTAASGMARFAGDDEVHYAAGLVIAAGAVAGAYVGAQLMHRLSPTRLRQAFAVLMVVVSLQMLLGFTPEGAAIPLGGPEIVVAYLLLGVVAGVLSGLMGVGGGVIMVPAMVLLFGFSQHAAEGTSLLIIIPTAIVGSIRHAKNGHTDWRLGMILGAGGVVGAWLGASVALGLDADLLQRLFAVFLLLTGAHLLWSTRPRRSSPAPADAV
jgi:uncharacterized membrane protein YfcA